MATAVERLVKAEVVDTSVAVIAIWIVIQPEVHRICC